MVASRRLGTLFIATLAVLMLFAAPALAHHCFNPNKPAGAGVNYTIVGFGQEGPILEQTGPGKGMGGFATLQGVDIHILGPNGAVDGTAGNPDAVPAETLCDERGLDYLACP